MSGIERVEIHHDKANTASGAVPRRLGFRFAGERPDGAQAPAELGIDCTWAVSRADWRPERRGQAAAAAANVPETGPDPV